MIQRKKRECKRCSKQAYIYAHGLCSYCYKTSLISKGRKEKDKQYEQDKRFYEQVWEQREHVCEVCGQSLYEPTTINFHHILPKSKYPHLRHDPTNIALLCGPCHYQHHTYPNKTIIQKPATK